MSGTVQKQLVDLRKLWRWHMSIRDGSQERG